MLSSQRGDLYERVPCGVLCMWRHSVCPPGIAVVGLLTYSMVQSPSWAANWFAASQEIPRISRNPKVHYRTHKRPPPVSTLGQPNPVVVGYSCELWWQSLLIPQISHDIYRLLDKTQLSRRASCSQIWLIWRWRQRILPKHFVPAYQIKRCHIQWHGNPRVPFNSTRLWRNIVYWHLRIYPSCRTPMEVEASWDVMAHAQKADFVFRRNGRVHLNQRGRQFIRLLAAELCASAVVQGCW